MASSKSWPISETGVLLPADDTVQVRNQEVDTNNMMVVDALGSTSQMSSEALGQTLMIEFGKPLFDQSSTPKEMYLIQKSGLKLNSEQSKTYLPSGGYLISLVDQEKCINELRSSQLMLENNPQATNVVGDLPLELNGDLCSSILTDADLKGGNKTIFIGDIASTLKSDIPMEGKSNMQVDSNDIEISLPSTVVQTCYSVLESAQLITNTGSKLPEQSLPLKKKAKMKGPERLAECSESSENRTSNSEKGPSQSKKPCLSEPAVKLPKGRGSVKRRCCYSESEHSEEDDNDSALGNEGLEISSCATIDDVVRQLRDANHIDEAFGELILKGIAEMSCDVLDEIKNREDNEKKFSYELLSFAFLLHFKRRSAYYFMRRGLKHKWPAVRDLMEFKKIVNSKPKKERMKRNAKKKK